MIKSFKVKNFRLFDQIEIKRLGRVNLVVGKNNAGKSAFLEALLIFFSKASVEVIYDLVHARQEHWESREHGFSRKIDSSPVRHLFKNHIIPKLHEDGFELSSDKKKEVLHVRTAAYILEESEHSTSRRRLDVDEIKNYENDFDDIALVVEIGGKTTPILSLHREFREYGRRIVSRRLWSEKLSYQFVSTQGISDAKASTLWDEITLTDMESEVIKGLKLIEPKVSGLAFVDNNPGRSAESRIPRVKLEGIEEPVPLKSLGDGMTRIFHIILSLVNAKGGILIVDEFENGLYWGVQSDVWEIVFKLSSQLNVQVFCTTHSRDCISGFEDAWSKFPDNGAFFRLFDKKGKTLVKEYDTSTLSDSLETDVEVR